MRQSVRPPSREPDARRVALARKPGDVCVHDPSSPVQRTVRRRRSRVASPVRVSPSPSPSPSPSASSRRAVRLGVCSRIRDEHREIPSRARRRRGRDGGGSATSGLPPFHDPAGRHRAQEMTFPVLMRMPEGSRPPVGLPGLEGRVSSDYLRSRCLCPPETGLRSAGCLAYRCP